MKVKLVGVRHAFPDLFEAVQFNGEGEFRYGDTFFIVKGSDNHKLVSDAVNQVATEAWKSKAPAMLESFKNNPNKYCVSDGDLKTYEGPEGCIVLAARRKAKDGRPGTFGLRGKTDPVTSEDGVLYSGCYVVATVDIWAQTKDFPGIRCTLLGVQFHSDGDAFSGGSTLDPDDFEDLSSGSDAPNNLV